jgi:hypothetical protein
MPSRFQKYSSITEELYQEFIKQSASGFIFSIIVGFLSTFFSSAEANSFRKYHNILCENLALDSIYLFFFFAIISWGAYFILLSCISSIYINFNEITMLKISIFFILYASGSLGILIGVRLSFRLSQLLNFRIAEQPCGVGNIYFVISCIALMFFGILTPYHYVLKPIFYSQKTVNRNSKFSYKSILYVLRPRLILFSSGAVMIFISIFALWFSTY